MNDLSTFEDAVASLRRFLDENGHPTDLFWVCRDDVWKRSPTDVLLKYPVTRENTLLAQKVFDEGRERGLVDVHAVATVAGKVARPFGSQSFPVRKFRAGIAE
jgi:hypothetical protein